MNQPYPYRVQAERAVSGYYEETVATDVRCISQHETPYKVMNLELNLEENGSGIAELAVFQFGWEPEATVTAPQSRPAISP